MQGAGGRRFYARLLSYSVWRNRYGFLTVQRHTADQKKTIMVLGFLASGNYFRDCSARRNCFYRTLDLSPYISSLRAHAGYSGLFPRLQGRRARARQNPS